MALIVAIEPDRRQADVLAGVARGSLGVELVVADSTRAAVKALGDRIPDLILTSLLLSPKDESALADRLRELDTAGIRVQTLVIPVFAASPRRARSTRRGLLTRLRGDQQEASHEGCDPAVFAAQVREYLDRVAADRSAAAAAFEDAQFTEPPTPPLPPAPERERETAPHGFEVESEWYPAQLPPHVEPEEASQNAFGTSLDSEPSSMPPLDLERLPDSNAASVRSLNSPIAAAPEPEAALPAEERPWNAHRSPRQQPPDDADERAAARLAAQSVPAGDADLMAFVAQLEREISESGDDAAPEAKPAGVQAGGDDVMRLDVPEIDLDFSEWLDEASAAPPAPEVVSSRSDDPLLELDMEVPLAVDSDSDLMEFFAVDSAPSSSDHVAGVETSAATASHAPPPEPDAVPAAPLTADAHQTPENPELLDLLTAIKRDIEQLRAGLPLSSPGSPSAPDAEPAPKKKGRSRKKKETLTEGWGFFDPQQSGFSALVSKLDEISGR